MKKILIPTIMIIVVILLIVSIIITKDRTVDPSFYNGTYTKEISNYINDKNYSTTTEIYVINNGNWHYKKIIKYSDNSSETISISTTGKIKNKTFNTTTGDKVYVDKNRICFDEEKNNCLTNTVKKEENKINEFVSNDHLFNIDSVFNIKDDNEIAFIVFTYKNCAACTAYKTVINKAVNDFDIDFFFYDLTKLKEDEIKYWNNYYQLTEFPTTYIFKNGELVDKIDGAMTQEKLYQTLLNNGIKGR